MESDIDSLLGGSLDFVYCCSCCNSLEFAREIKCPFKLKDKSVKNSKIMKNYNTITIQLQLHDTDSLSHFPNGASCQATKWSPQNSVNLQREPG